MRLGVLLVLSFVAIALLVGLVGYLSGVTSDEVLQELEDLRRSSIAEVTGATGMVLALQSSQLAAQELVAERYRAQVEASHESEWGVAGDIERGAVTESLNAFEAELERSREAVRTAIEIAREHGDRAEVDAESRRLSESLRGIERSFTVYREKMRRFVHLARYHPSDQVREFVEDELKPHYRNEMLPLISAYEQEAMANLNADTEAIEAALAAGDRRNKVLTLVALAAAVLLGLLIFRSISKPLGRLREAVLKIGRGQLGEPIEVEARNEIGILAEAFNQMTRDLQASTVSRSYLDNILQSMEEMLIVTDAEGQIRTVNQVASRQLGFGREELIGRAVTELLADAAPGSGETLLRSASDATIPVSLTASVLKDEGGEVTGTVYVARDISARKRAEEELRRSLSEKEVLLKEVHHRVKNNLQIISSLLNLQGEELEDADAERRFRESQNRIRSMALIHEQLYRSPDLSGIDFSEYVERLVQHIVNSYGPQAHRVESRLEIEARPLSLDCAIPCGMIVNELVANAIEHAFPDGAGTVSVRFRSDDGRRHLEVRDDGVGLPPELDPEQAATLGLRLVTALARQLGGEYLFEVEGGTGFRVSFDPDAQRGEVPLTA